jgi:hypothetical protein
MTLLGNSRSRSSLSRPRIELATQGLPDDTSNCMQPDRVTAFIAWLEALEAQRTSQPWLASFCRTTYQDAGGSDDTFGFAQIGARASVLLGAQTGGGRFGAWTTEL